jgi:hypothetical protein
VIDEASGGGSVVGQHRLEVDTSGEARTHLLHVIQVRDATGEDVEAQLAENEGSLTVTLSHPRLGTATIVFQKGMTSMGGSFGYAARGASAVMTPLLDRVQSIRVTDDGVLWNN